ncbi:MAG TPA: HPr kinase/phosphatase C-terminal domain-containing protein [Caulobacteraceae bacterium]|jgi:serine kinase of HPr protein (carbohydrate metabolism regulator)
MSEILHASLIATRVRETWRGALIEGASATGKSDLALRCLSAGFSLVADDRVVVFAAEGSLWGRAPDTLAGLIEARGVGVFAVSPLPFARIDLAVDLAATPDEVERLPEALSRTILGISLPAVGLWPFEAAAPTKLAVLLQCGNVDQLRHLGARP